ncbi:MAG: DinB family protein, partial [Bacteroidota bacterium]
MPTKTLLSILRAAAPQLEAIPDEVFSQSSGPGRWSQKQILGHLIDSAYNNHQRFLRAPHQDHLRFVGYDQEEWVLRNAYQERDKAEVIQTFLTVQTHLAQAIATQPEEVLSRQ